MGDSYVAEPSHDAATSQASMSLLVPLQERSGCETPLSVDSIPLEWDHTGDVGGSSSHEEDDDASFFSCLSGNCSSNASADGYQGLLLTSDE